MHKMSCDVCVYVCVCEKREMWSLQQVVDMAKALQAPQKWESGMWKTFCQLVETAPWIAEEKEKTEKQKWCYHSPK